MNKKDEKGIVIKNKARLVAQGYTQEEGIDYDEVFAPVARIETIRLFLAYTSFNFVVYQMDVKSAFIYGEIEKEVYVCQPPGFEDPDFPDIVYKVENALYGLNQAPRAWYETLSSYLLDNGFQRGKIDNTLFIRRDKSDILKFQMSSMGELTFFLGLQIKKKEDRIFISQDKYVTEILKKFGFIDVKTASTPMETQNPLLKDEDGKEVDVHLYRSMTGSLMYLTSSRPDIIAKQQTVVWLFHNRAEYVADQVCSAKRELLLAKFNAARHKLTYFALKFNAAQHNLQTACELNAVLQALVDRKKILVTEASVRRDLQLDDEEATNQKFNFSKYIFESMVKNLDNAGKFLMYPRFIQVFLDNQLEGMSSHKRIYVTPSHTKKIFANMRRQGKDFSGRVTPLFPTMVVQAQEEMGEGSAMPTDPHHTPIITQPSSSQPQRKQKSRRPKEKDTQVPQSSVPSDPTNVADEAVNEEPTQEITSLKKRVKNLEKKGWSRTHKLKRLYMVGRSARVVSSKEASLGDQEDASKQGRKIDDIDKDVEITLVDETQGRYGDENMFGVNDLDGDEVFVESEVTDKAGEKRNIIKEAVAVTDAVTIPVSAATITNVELTLAQTLAELKSARPKTKGVKGQGSKDKGKAKMIEPEKLLKKKYQIKFDEEETLRLHVKFDEEDRFVREKAQQVEEPNIDWDDIQAKINADYQLAERLQIQEQQELTIEEKSTLFNIAGWKPKDLKNKSFDKAFKRVNTFVDFRTELVEGTEMKESSKKAEVMEESSSKRAGDELEQESTKKQKVDDDQEGAKMKELMKIIPDEEEVVVDAIPLATKPPSIVDWKIMLRSFNREDLETLWKLVKAKHGYTRPEKGYESVMGFQNMHVFMLVEKRYPLTPATITDMLNKKLQADHWNEMCYQLLKLITKQLKNQ
ncbi:putative ribonuclease H-like domain-containing protein [Tanacetum coccineum]